MTGLASRLPAPPSWVRLPRPTARLRLTMLYGCLFTLAGAGLLGFTYWLFDRAIAGAGAGVQIPPAAPHLPCSFAHPTRGCLTLVHFRAGLRQFDLHALAGQSAIALAVMAALAFALGWLVAGRVLRPLRTITATARRISATSLHERLALAGPDDEFKELADTLDSLLARLEASFTAQRTFVANASHELRTPLTLDRTLLQVALRNPSATIEQWRATGQELLASGQQQERILEALLTLASSQAGTGRHEPVDLSEVTTARLHAARARIQRQRLHLQASLSPAPLHGDPDLIDRLTANLLDNAIQHNTPDGTIEITTTASNGHAVMTVANTGPLIPPAQVSRLFQPFQRLAARTSNGNEHGLGLSIVAAIATAHRADVAADARPDGGLRIQVSFPASQDEAAPTPTPEAAPGPYGVPSS
jgi:signal transduction histidine kinase